jgi:citrate synthase
MTTEKTEARYVTAEEAARWLGVNRATLYAYVSRGMIRSEPVVGSKARQYDRADVEALAKRGRGAGPKASTTALRFGEPILESGVSLIQGGRLYYRGRDATELAGTHTFEAVAALLWTGELGGATWPAPNLDAKSIETLGRIAARGAPLERALAGIAAIGIGDAVRFAPMREQVARSGGRIVRAVVALMAPPPRARATLAASTTAEAVWTALAETEKPADGVALAALDAALVLCADHELNASTFAARLAASTGTNLYAVVAAALAVLSGPRHGSASDRVEALMREIERESADPVGVPAALAARLARGETLVEYGHPLYPDGDPRFPALRRLCDGLKLTRSSRAAIARVDALNDAARQLGFGEPTLDVGLVALRIALGLPVGSAAAVFAAGRTVGWIAHALEQSASSHILRPRARYVGVPPS